MDDKGFYVAEYKQHLLVDVVKRYTGFSYEEVASLSDVSIDKIYAVHNKQDYFDQTECGQLKKLLCFLFV